MDTGITPVMNVGSGCGYDGTGMNSGAWIFGLIVLAALFNGGFGGFGGRGYCGQADNSVLEAINLSNGQQTAQLEAAANQRQNCMDFINTNGNISNGFANLSRDLCSQSFGIVNTITSGNADIKDRLANMAAQQADCCCTILRGIDGINYNAAINTAAINANTSAAVQKVLDVICQNKIEALQDSVKKLELQQAVAGVVRYPNGMVYSAGTSPFCPNSGCGCVGY